MPELPEVETTRRGIMSAVEHQMINEVIVRQPQLRTRIPDDLAERLVGERVGPIERRAKYLLLPVAGGHLLWHLGMSGSLRLVPIGTPPQKHDHVDLVMGSDTVLRYHDPRRFGVLDFITGDPYQDRRLVRLGPEPLSTGFDGAHLFRASRRRRVAVKSLIMDNAVVVGVGNIYAAESLFLAGIDPRREAGRISQKRYSRLGEAIKQVLTAAITQGGTTLRDFVSGSGSPGYFAQQLNVYGRSGLPCRVCGAELLSLTLGQRASVYCPVCQT
ncbi:bifunctional DNA-formamidopyrimidine glycosylase/DNA-(apurinic or apyrimidinic site) lyase [Kushneria phosphatilytica]|uniref:Formamidopyrimidine-DNA glycosylase n=1 Tax=Kushneria phosphatilytica TaxID=657387 RepID=A0A1S1NQQ8_9GAMM|nr:bifunctional DNA-formamidopyrimidine glycosylase/DNA-(apurinic or apyrimidinic site) lyase [Kushneria phosphatilytica]OHV10914.1 DNA-formamidopyrimidine glycosylase [Kushneria phosphatilytica]QEL12000.1 bifunctional DNA-formamidopyrimidine glycosylase/DNA-(apurinic or apyrimidinic site) lyase [Kushneria phosphatilytica]